MLKLLEVFEPIVDERGTSNIKVACVDVTENTEAERDTLLTELKALYGSSCTYRKQDCGHDEGRPCHSQEV